MPPVLRTTPLPPVAGGFFRRRAYATVFLALHCVVHFWLHFAPRALCRVVCAALRTAHTAVHWCFPSVKDDVFLRAAANFEDRDHHCIVVATSHHTAAPWLSWRGEAASVDPMPTTAPLYNGHLNTILANFKSVPDLVYTRQVADGDGVSIVIDWALPTANGAAPGTTPRAVVALIPGLTSTARTPYLQSFAGALVRQNYAVAVVHPRGFAGSTLPPGARMMCGSMTGDLRAVMNSAFTVDAVTARLGLQRPVFLLGFSLGANLVSKYLSEVGDEPLRRTALRAALALQAPWCFHDSYDNMRRLGPQVLYHHSFTSNLVKLVEESRHALYDPERGQGRSFDWHVLGRLSSVAEFDEHVIAPHHGYPNVKAYYDDASCFPRLHTVAVPLLCVAAADDSVCGPPPALDLWQERVEATQGRVTYVRFPAGGHLGFLGSPLREYLGRPNELEVFIGRCLGSYCDRIDRDG